MSTSQTELAARFESLSSRERQVLEMAARGMTNGQIAGLLHVSAHVVKFHLASVYRKLGAANRTQATVLLYESGVAPRYGIDSVL